MKSIILSVFAIFLTVSATARELTPAPTQPRPPHVMLWGSWIAEHPIQNRNLWIWADFDFTADTMTMHATCEFQGQNVSLTVGVSSHVAYHNNDIHVFDHDQNSVNDGFRYCNAGLNPATWQFYFHNTDVNRAVLIAPIPYQQRFYVTRVTPTPEEKK